MPGTARDDDRLVLELHDFLLGWLFVACRGLRFRGNTLPFGQLRLEVPSPVPSLTMGSARIIAAMTLPQLEMHARV